MLATVKQTIKIQLALARDLFSEVEVAENKPFLKVA